MGDFAKLTSVTCLSDLFEPLAEGRVVSVKATPPDVKCHRFHFSASGNAGALAPKRKNSDPKANPPKSTQAAKPSTRTRIRLPQDVVKLEQRLFYLLQPPIESILCDGNLEVPFEPFSYQLEGISFLYPRHMAVLADEMGLGKTMQAITSMRMLLHAREVGSVILVCPKPLIPNWKREFALWAGEIPVTVVEGSAERRKWAWQRSEFPIKIANYESVLRDSHLVESGQISADMVVLDEAQRIKNAHSSTSQVIRKINRTRSWALTGTPIENSTNDLVGIFEFLSSGMLRPDMANRDLAQATSDYILRRTKDQVLTDMPPKLFRDAYLELSPAQRAQYDSAESDGVVKLADLGQSITIQHVFELVLRLKQICNFDLCTGQSSKLDRLKVDLEEVAQSGKKAIVFSQWVNTLNRLEDELSQFNPLAYHGRITPKEREESIRRFRETDDHSVMLISYGAGSVGLNLQFCNYVFLFDRWWNPAVEDQAINRAHRIGSSGPVTITRFVTPGTIEQRIDDILTDKRELMAQILDNQDTPRQIGLSQKEIFGLFDLSATK